MIYKAICACYGGEEEEADYGFKTERHHALTFEAGSKEDAVRAALRWYRDRMRCFPEVFFELWSIKVGGMVITSVDDSGGCLTGYSGTFFEWKYDGYDTVEDRIQDLRKKEASRSQA